MKSTAVAPLMASLGLHAALFAGALRLPGPRASWSNDLVPITLEEIQDLPLQQPPKPHEARAQGHDAPRARRVTQPDPGRVVVAPKARDTDPVPAAKPAQPAPIADVTEATRRGDVSAYGPEGSRVVAILRLDRLRAAPDARADIAAVDDLLRLLPDRQRLLENTGLDLYRDFELLLVATPNPFDDSATFVAARHRLGDGALRAALDRGAKAGGGAIKWRMERGRSVGVRKGPGRGSAPGRDERLILLPAPGLLVIASPVYAKWVLDEAASGSGGATATDSPPGGHRERSFSDLVARVDAEDGAIPEDAAFVLTASNLVPPGGATVVAGATKRENASPKPPGPATPSQLSLLVGTNPTPFLELRAEFEHDEEAQSCEAQWPAWKQELLANPLVLLAGAGPLLSRTELHRDERTVVLRTTMAGEEMLRLLRMIASLAASGDAGRAPGLPRPGGER